MYRNLTSLHVQPRITHHAPRTTHHAQADTSGGALYLALEATATFESDSVSMKGNGTYAVGEMLG